jgi:hypothetical protein
LGVLKIIMYIEYIKLSKKEKRSAK